ncbi:MAG: DmsC/YnfH family molybdoenzyme membrane anchor subunit [Burkholderiaceae bacterium]
MNPAWSVILFTVSSGAGLGLAFWLAMSRLAHEAEPSRAWWGSLLLAVVLLTIGLISSTGHLANPKNAWRAFSRFGTSWLSREGVFAVLFYPTVGIYALSLLSPDRLVQNTLGVAVMVMALATLYCTGMIYGCLKTIPLWHGQRTALAYPVLGLFSGAVLLTALVPVAAAPIVRWIALGFGVLSVIIKFMHFQKAGSVSATAESALRQKGGHPRMLDPGHSHATFLTREFGFEAEAGRIRLLRGVVWVLAFLVPGLILWLAPLQAWWAVIAMALGLFAERWLFFAEARHVVRLYHGAASV